MAKWIPCNAVRVLPNGSVQVKVKKSKTRNPHYKGYNIYSAVNPTSHKLEWYVSGFEGDKRFRTVSAAKKWIDKLERGEVKVRERGRFDLW